MLASMRQVFAVSDRRDAAVPSPMLRGMAVALCGGMLACAAIGSLRAQEWDGEVHVEVQQTSDALAGVRDGVSVVVERETGEQALRIAAFVNDAMRRAGLRSNATAPMRLYVHFSRPEMTTVDEQPPVSVTARGGWSKDAARQRQLPVTEPEVGLEVQMPVKSRSNSPELKIHRLTARLETAPGEVGWQAVAETEAVPGKDETAVLKRLAARIVDAFVHLVKAAGAKG